MNTTTIAVRPGVPRASRTKRCRAAWLLPGWAALWFVSVLQPCTEVLIGSAHAANGVAAAPYMAADSAVIAHGNNEIPCITFFDIRIAPLGVSTTSFPTPDTDGTWITAPSLLPARQPDHHAAHRGDDAPPPSVPAYLLSLRLLI